MSKQLVYDRDFMAGADLRPGLIYRTCCSAVLPQLTGHRDAAVSYRAATLAAYRKVTEAWCARLWALKKFGWTPVTRAEDAKLSRLQRLRNCPPFGITGNGGEFFFCGRYRVCPWCYARGVIGAAFQAVSEKCQQMIDGKVADGYKLVAVRCVIRHLPLAERAWDRTLIVPDVTPGGKATEAKIMPWPAATMHSMWGDYNRFKEVATVHGARLNVVMAPDDQDGTIYLRRGTLLLLDRNAEIPALRPDTKVLEYTVTMANICRALAWCMPYPRGMLRGDAQTTVDILEGMALKRTPMVKGTGWLASGTPWMRPQDRPAALAGTTADAMVVDEFAGGE